MFEKLKSASQSDRQTILSVLRLVVENHAEVSFYILFNPCPAE